MWYQISKSSVSLMCFGVSYRTRNNILFMWPYAVSLISYSWPAVRGVVFICACALYLLALDCTIACCNIAVSSVQSHYPMIVTSNILVITGKILLSAVYSFFQLSFHCLLLLWWDCTLLRYSYVLMHHRSLSLDMWLVSFTHYCGKPKGIPRVLNILPWHWK